MYDRRQTKLTLVDFNLKFMNKYVHCITFFQKPLPKLPVPDLKCTLDTYLTIMKSVLTDEEYNRTKLIVEDFGKPGGKGEMLQEKLRKVAESKDNWVITMRTWTGFFSSELTTS